MANTALTNGERYTFARQGNVTVITDSTDSAEGTKIINNNLTLSGSASRQIRIETETSTNDAHVHFKSSTTDFSAGVNGSENSFEIGTATSLTGEGSTSTALRIPDVASPKVHCVWGMISSGSAQITGSLGVTGSLTIRNLSTTRALTVTGSLAVNGSLEVTGSLAVTGAGSVQISNDAFDATSYSYIMTTVATGSDTFNTWSIPSATTDRMFYIHSAEQYTGATITGGDDYLQIKTVLTGIGTIAWHETNDKPQYNHSFLIPAGIACVVTFIKGANTVASGGVYLEWLGHSIKLGG